MPAPKTLKLCTQCPLTFTKDKTLRKHIQQIHPPPVSCAVCNLRFPTKKVFRRHKREVHPSPSTCPVCNITFNRKSVRLEHQREMHPKCKDCKEGFYRPEDLRAHKLETGHLHCQECDIYFLNTRLYTTHVRTIQHATEYHCCDCDREYTGQEQLDNHCCFCDKVFISQDCLFEHFTTPSHLGMVTRLESQLDGKFPHKCGLCSKEFPTKKTLNKHKSTDHKPPRNIPCPVGGKCIKKFATPSALLNHLESGCCRAGMNRTKLAELVFVHDPNRYITAAAHMPVREPESQFSGPAASITGSPHILPPAESTLPPLNTDLDDDDSSSEWSFTEGAPLTPTSSDWSLIRSGGALLTPAIRSGDGSEWSFTSGNFVATPLSNMSVSEYNNTTTSFSETRLIHNNLRCHLCPPERQPFGSAKALQTHIDSAAHAPKMYHCPLSFMPNVKPEDLLKRRSFSTLGGLTQHLEGGGCEGGMELYRRAILFVEEQLESLGLGGIQLLRI